LGCSIDLAASCWARTTLATAKADEGSKGECDWSSSSQAKTGASTRGEDTAAECVGVVAADELRERFLC